MEILSAHEVSKRLGISIYAVEVMCIKDASIEASIIGDKLWVSKNSFNKIFSKTRR